MGIRIRKLNTMAFGMGAALAGVAVIPDVLAFDDAAKDRVTVVEMGRRAVGDEELATVGSRAGIRHRQDARTVVA